MNLGIRLKIFLASFAVIVVSVMAGDAYLAHAVHQQLTDQLEQDLLVRARLVALAADALPAPFEDAAAWDKLADEHARAAGVRITLVAAGGRVLGDSEVDTADVTELENHAARAEIAAALAAGSGESTRLSTTLGAPLMYAAVPFGRAQGAEGRPRGVARVAKPLVAVDEAVGRMHRAVFLAMGLALLLAVPLSSVAAQRLSAVVRGLTETARKMTRGDLDVRSGVGGNDELTELGSALDQLAGSLKSTLEELRAERDLQRRILEGMQEGVLVVDGVGRIVTMNHALREMLFLPADATGASLGDLVRHAELDKLMGAARITGQASGELDLQGIEPRRLLAFVTALRGDGDEGLIAVFVDVTDLRRLESLRRDFVANVSHELKTPVTAVRSAAETLRASVANDPKAAIRFVDMIERNAQRLQNLIEDLLELSRIESKAFRVQREKVDLASIFSIVVGLFRERAAQKGITVEGRGQRAVVDIETDARALEQILSNLLDNAVKYCPAGSRVTLEATAADEDHVRITVADDGPGIDARHLPRLFERFYRVDAGRSRELGGTGLGLAIVKHLAETLLGGSVSVESRVGEGSTFVLLLPKR